MYKNVRKSLLAFAVLAGVSATAYAQSETKGDRIRFGVKGGVHISNMHYSNLDQYDAGSTTGGVGGIFAEFDLGKKRRFSIRPEILFLSRGSEVNGLDKLYDEDFNYRLKAKYTDIRIPIIYNFNNPDKISPYIYVAPIVSFARGGSIDYTTYDSYGDPLEWPSADVSKASFKTVSFSAAAGVGVRIPVRLTDTKRLFVGIEANYQYGFTDTYGNEKDGEAIALNRNVYDITGTRKNRGFEIAASVSVPISIFKKTKKPKKEVYVPEPVVVEEKPVVKEKPCYTLDEIIQLLAENQSIKGKTICAIDQIEFEFGKSAISSGSYAYLDKIAELMKRSSVRIEIKGHTDNVGKEDFNLNLSKQRAKAVYDYLINKGVDKSQLSYSYYGMSKPLMPNDTEEGRKINRRVEFEILN